MNEINESELNLNINSENSYQNENTINSSNSKIINSNINNLNNSNANKNVEINNSTLKECNNLFTEEIKKKFKIVNCYGYKDFNNIPKITVILPTGRFVLNFLENYSKFKGVKFLKSINKRYVNNRYVTIKVNI